MEDLLSTLKAFVEGEMKLAEWRIWWNENASVIEPKVSRICFLRLKHQPFLQAENLLEEYGIAFQPDRSKCQKCGESLFLAVPGETTREEIINFARSITLPWAEQIAKDGWIHPGSYCPNGCTHILINYGNGDLWERMEVEFEKTHTCPVTITARGTLLHPLSSYSVYIDGNIAKTRYKDSRPDNGELVLLRPGDHRIVVREADVKKVDRLESNTLWFAAAEDIPLHFQVGMLHGHLKLIQRKSKHG